MQSSTVYNREFYNLNKVVNYYKTSTLQPAEATFFSLLRTQLPNMRMLDIGVGGGRTTHHFGPVVKSYVGIDYAEKMIEACRQTCNNLKGDITFDVCDARDLSQFSDEEFDIILFSFNGIDYVSESDRQKIFKEIQRVGKKGAWFCFSSSNIQWFSTWSKIGFVADPIRLLARVRHYFLLRYYNPNLQKQLQENVGLFTSGAHNYSLKTHFIRPIHQLQQLEALGFKNPQAYRSETEKFSKDRESLAKVTANWVYYLTNI